MNTNGVSIRKITEEDTDNILKWRNSPDVNINFIYRRPLTREDHLNWLHKKVETGEVAQFIIHSDVLDRDVGSVYLRDIDNNYRKAEYGIFIGEECARGHGIGTKAAKLILEYGFNELELNRIFLRVFARNERAVASYKKAGFVYEGLFRQDVIVDGVKEDVVFMSILKEDYDKDLQESIKDEN